MIIKIVYIYIFLISGCIHGHQGKIITNEPINQNTSKINVIPLTNKGDPYVITPSSDGTFTINSDIPDGDYLVEAIVPGYGVTSTRFNTNSKEGKIIIKLEKLSEIEHKSFSANFQYLEGKGSGNANLTPPQM